VEKVLTPREKHIIFHRYGLGGRKEETQLEIARRLGISRSYVSRIEKKALGKLKTAYQQPKQ
jgi:RNA polymerase sporulation-specific sigma factor